MTNHIFQLWRLDPMMGLRIGNWALATASEWPTKALWAATWSAITMGAVRRVWAPTLDARPVQPHLLFRKLVKAMISK